MITNFRFAQLAIFKRKESRIIHYLRKRRDNEQILGDIDLSIQGLTTLPTGVKFNN